MTATGDQEGAGSIAGSDCCYWQSCIFLIVTRSMKYSGVFRPCLGEYVKPPVSVIMNTYDKHYWGINALILTTSLTFEFSLPSGFWGSDDCRSLKLIAIQVKHDIGNNKG